MAASVKLTGEAVKVGAIPNGFGPLIERFLTLRGCQGQSSCIVAFRNDKDQLDTDGIKVQNHNRGSVKIRVQIGGRDQCYTCHLVAQGGDGNSLYNALTLGGSQRFMSVRSLHVAESTNVEQSTNGEVSVQLKSGDLAQDQTNILVPTPAPVALSLVESKVEPVSTTSPVQAPQGGVKPRNLHGFSKNVENVKFALLSIHTSLGSIVPSKGVGTFFMKEFKMPEAGPRAFAPMVQMLTEAGYLERVPYPGKNNMFGLVLTKKGSELIGADSSEKPVGKVGFAPAVEPVAGPAPVVPSEQAQSLLSQLTELASMAKEYGAAADECARINDTVKVHEERAQLLERELSSLKSTIVELLSKRAKWSSVLNSQKHKQAREILATLRDLNLNP